MYSFFLHTTVKIHDKIIKTMIKNVLEGRPFNLTLLQSTLFKSVFKGQKH